MPTEIKRYEIVALLATGGMGEVFLARAKGLGGFQKLFAIKRIRPELARLSDFTRMLLDEARIAATLHHSNVVQVFDVDTDDGAVFLVMEYLHGRDARQILNRARELGGPVPLEQALNIALGVAAGLHYAHEKTDDDGQPLGIVHRDVSPHNVIVTYDGAVKVIDFGIAKASVKLTATLFGVVRGKPGYMSPEQCAGEVLDRRSDVFCIAILLYELTVGSSPFDATDQGAFFNAVLNGEPVRPRTVRPRFPEELERILMKGLARDRDVRYASALELRRDLEKFARTNGLALSPYGLAEYMDRLFHEESASFRLALESGTLADYVMAVRTSGQHAKPVSATRTVPIGVSSSDPPISAGDGLTLPIPEPPPASQPAATLDNHPNEPRPRMHRKLGRIAVGVVLAVSLGVVSLALFRSRDSEANPATAVASAIPVSATEVPPPSSSAAPVPTETVQNPSEASTTVRPRTAAPRRAPIKSSSSQGPTKRTKPPVAERSVDLESPLPR